MNVTCSRLKKTGCCSLLIFVLKVVVVVVLLLLSSSSSSSSVPADMLTWSWPMCTKAWEFMCEMAVPWLRQLVTSLSPQGLWFDLRPDPAGFVVDKVAWRQVFL